MMNYCGMCRFSLDAAALRAGRCPNCGAPIDSPGDALGRGGADVADITTRPDALADASTQPLPYAAAASNAAGGSAHGVPEWQAPRLQAGIGRNRERGSRRRRRSRGVSRIWRFAFLALVLVLLADMAVYAITQRNPLSIIVSPFTSSNASASSDASSSSSSAGGTATASGTSTAAAMSHTPAATPQTPAGAPPGGGTGSNGSPTQPAASAPTAAPTATPVPPTLSVSPTTFTFTACLLVNKAQFTVANTGGTPMSWSASAGGSGYTVTPSSGSIEPGEHETVTVSNILRSGTVTITAPSAHNSPQRVSITCTV